MALALDRRPRQAARLAVRRLALLDFRGYAQLRLETDPRPVVLTGPNGAGKTNLLEAISFLAPGRGLRRARLGEVDRSGGAGPWSVVARLEAPGGAVEIRTGRAQDGERERRTLQIDGSDALSQAALAEVVAVVWLTPAMDRLFLDGAGERRRFLDRLVVSSDPAHAAQLARYAHALRQRARLLRAGRVDPSWLRALERQVAAAGVAVAAARRETVRGLAAALIEPPAGFPQPELALDGQVEAWLGELPALDAEERFGEALAAARRAGCRDRDHRDRTASQRPAGPRPRLGPPRPRLLDRPAEGAPGRPDPGRGAAARGGRRTAADPAPRRGRGPSRCGAPGRRCSRRCAPSAPRPG